MRRSRVWAVVLAGGICLGLLAGCGARAVGKTAAERAPGLARPEPEQTVETADQGETLPPSDEIGAVEAPAPEDSQSVSLEETDKREASPSAETGRLNPAGADQDGGSAGGAIGAELEGENPSAADAGDLDKQAEHTHDWQPIYETVHHDEVGYYETRILSEAYDEPVCKEMNVCSACGAAYVSPDDMAVHIIVEHDGAAAYSNQNVQVDTIHHDAVTQEIWVVDQPAYDEQVVAGYQCACGAAK